ncbi:MAG: hypothetical protein WEB09_01085 [Nitriliruptor sp.]
MGRTELIAELDRRILAAEDALVAARAEMAGLKAQRAVLQRSVGDRGELTGLPRTEAIIEVLERSPSTLTVAEVQAALAEGGRQEDSANAVRATLSYLKKADRVAHLKDGTYVSVG